MSLLVWFVHSISPRVYSEFCYHWTFLLSEFFCVVWYTLWVIFEPHSEVWYIPPTQAKSLGEGKPRPSRARLGGISFFFIMSFLSKFNLGLDLPSRSVTGLIVYFSDLHILRGEVWKIHCQTCHTLWGKVWQCIFPTFTPGEDPLLPKIAEFYPTEGVQTKKWGRILAAE